MTPHAAFYSTASLADMRRLSIGYLVDVLRTGTPKTCVNADLLRDAARKRRVA